MKCSRQEYWSEKPFPSPGDLPYPGVEPGSPALQAGSLPSESPGKCPWELSCKRQTDQLPTAELRTRLPTRTRMGGKRTQGARCGGPTQLAAFTFFICLNNSIPWVLGFPDSSVGKESACSAKDPGSIPGLGRSTGEGIGYPLQYSWASAVALLVKNLPAMQETWVGKIPWRRERLHTPVFWLGEFHGLYGPRDHRVWHDWVTFTFMY